ncbi:uncharacterized protein LOC118419400 [Branchiostoma floridae]|uniref:Uncharacterized protein LOC118419400 n=1 Tax=Branchiostoma floridae TaxID=7739 RepID=A0A9J7LH79_BRAFL|nr:uncharacterized protein LOC118419400 [Branchiostoma floridae]
MGPRVAVPVGLLVLLALAAGGTAQATKGFTVRAQSYAWEDPGFRDVPYNSRDLTYIVVGGQKSNIDEGLKRGHQVFILNEQTGQVVSKAAFDTWVHGDAEAATKMATFLGGAAEGRIIAVVVHDSGDFTGGLSSVLAPYGSTITYLGRRESYAMITQKGPKPSWFVEKRSAKGAGPTTVEAFIPPATKGFTVRAQSYAWEDPGFRDVPYNSRDLTYIVVGGQKRNIDEGLKRGHQVFILNEQTGQVVSKAAFDTWVHGDAEAATKMATFLGGAAEGRIIVVVVHDSGDFAGGLSSVLAPYGSTITYLDLETRRVCEGGILTISCPAGKTINIVSAMYGRTQGPEVCPHPTIGNTNCISKTSLSYMRSKCQGKSRCSVAADNGRFGDPCMPFTYKYLEVEYTCGAGKPDRRGLEDHEVDSNKER